MNARGGAAIAAGVLGFCWTVSHMGSPVAKPEAERGPASVQREAPFARSKTETAKETFAKPVDVKTSQVHDPAPNKVWPDSPFQYQRDLDEFSKLRNKIFLSDDEKVARKRLLTDVTVLRAIGMRLVEASLNPGVTASQDSAVEFLIEAMKGGDASMASEVARTVVEDSQVENPSLDRALRENLAGIKAEVLYHWAAIMPNDANNIERALPGPVSQKIWSNVTHRHASNAAESDAEIRDR